jgi:flagellar hook-length control protein FliK
LTKILRGVYKTAPSSTDQGWLGMSNMDSLGRPSSPSGQTNSQISPANKGDDDSAGQSLFDGLFSLVNQADPAVLEAAQGLPAKAIFMSLSPVDQDNKPDSDALPVVDAGQMSFLDSDKEGSDKLTRLLLAAAEIVPDAGLPPVSVVATSDMTASDMTASDMMASGISLVAASSESVLLVRSATALDAGADADAKSVPKANNSGNAVPAMELAGSSVDADTTSQFVGPMPLTDSDRSLFGGTAGAHQVLVRPHAGFVGPMPQPLHHHQPASMPLPLAISIQDGWQIMEPPSRSFIGPMPAVPKPDFLAGNGGMSSEADMLRDKGTIVSKPQDQSVQLMSKSAANTVKTLANPAKPIQAAMTGGKAAADVALQSVQSVQAAAISGEQTRTSRAYSDAVQASSAGNTSAADSPAAASNGSGQSSSGGGHGGGAQHQAAQAADGFGARDASARMVVHRLNTERHGWAGTMVRQLDAGLKNGTQSIRIILQPGNLGRLNVDLGLRKGAAHIRVGAESAEAAQLLKGARHHLSQMLEQSGMRLAGLQTVNIGGEGGPGQGGHGQQEAAGENGGRKQAFSNKMQQPDGVAATQTGEADTQDLLPRAGENAVLSILA